MAAVFLIALINIIALFFIISVYIAFCNCIFPHRQLVALGVGALRQEYYNTFCNIYVLYIILYSKSENVYKIF